MNRRHQISFAEEDIDLAGGITVSDIRVQRKYMMDVTFYSDQKFVGDIIPLPEVLVKYLKDTELKVFTFIFGQLKNDKMCTCRRAAISNEIGVSVVSVSKAMSNLEKMGILKQGRAGKRKIKEINFDTIQKLNDLLTDRKPGAARAFRDLMKTCDIRMPSETALATLDIQYSYKDEIESEEYN